MLKRRYFYKERKQETLALFEACPEGFRPEPYAWKIGEFPPRAAYSYLAQLWRWGLLLRRENPARYRISARGRRRLAWLRPAN